MAQFVYEANRSRVFLNGIEFFLLQDVRGEDRYPRERVSGIGEIEARELPPTEAIYSFTMAGYILKTEQSIRAGIIPENGTVALEGQVFDIEIFSKDGPLLKKWSGAVCETANYNLSAHRLFMKSGTFQATTTTGTLQ